jgi:Asp-tRNA(Asn)/Glu-tRNA(Gln) amidotransferase A subunit family amidase
MVPIALGTQTGGSVLRPASYCGVAGFKPTQGAVNRAGIKPAAERFDTVGILAQDFNYAAALFGVLTNGGASWATPPRKPARVGVTRTPFWPRARPETVSALEASVQFLRAAGVGVDDLVLPKAFEGIGESRATINDFQRAHTLRYEWATQPELISPELALVIQRGLVIPLARFTAAVQHVERCRSEFIELCRDVDVVLAPCVDGEAPVGLGSTGEHHFQSLWTTIDVPTANLPLHKAPSGMPVSVQLIARPWHDPLLLGYARWFMGDTQEA